MVRGEAIKNEILKQYKSVRAFALELGIPYSTLVTGLERGVESMGFGTVLSMCDALSINPVDCTPLDSEVSLNAVLFKSKVMTKYLKLNEEGQEKILELMDDFAQIQKYKAIKKKPEK